VKTKRRRHEDKPIPVANNDNEENIKFNREETTIEDTPKAITGADEQENTNE